MKSNGKFSLRFLFACMIFFCVNQLVSAQNAIYYSYDENGNRLTRCITLKKGAIADSDYIEEPKKESFKDEIGEAMVLLYPNPTKGNLEIAVTGATPEAIIEYAVYAASGAIIKKQTVSDHLFNVDFTNHPSGIYILKLSVAGKTSEWKIIKE